MRGSLSRVALLTAALLAALPAWASDPQLGRIAPPGGQRGTEIDVVLSGARLGDAQEVFLYEPGIKVLSLAAEKDGTVKARLAIAADCRVGPHGLRLRTASGITNLRTFSVGVLPQIEEKEPNNDFAQPQKIPMNVTVQGVVQNEDVDYFAVEAKKGQRIAVEVEGFRLGDTFFDPAIAVMNTERFVLAEADDTPLVRQDGAVTAIAPADGTYIVQVRESSFRGSGDCRYRLHVGDFPRPLAAYPAGGKPGQPLEVRWLGDAAGEWTQLESLPGRPDPLFGLLAKSPQGVAPSPNFCRVVDLPNMLEVEPNDLPQQGTVGMAPAAFNGVLSKPGDVDHFQFAAKQGQVFDIRVHARSVRSPVDSVLTILRSNGSAVASNDDTDTPDSYVRFTAPADDNYTIAVRDQLGQGGAEYVYRVEVSPPQPRLTMLLPERTQYIDILAPVPSGNRTAMMIAVQREDLGGEVKMELGGLPPGLTAEFLPFAADETQVPVLLTAAAGAKPAGALVDVIGRQTEGSRTVEGHLRQRTSLVRGQNNREVCNFYTERMATAVTQAVPFQIEIVEPKVPVVQSGSMDLKIAAKRTGDFKAPITIAMLYNPPGVSTPTTVTIPEGQSEVILPLTAEGGAPVKKWKIAVLGTATVGDGAITVSSQLANLEVAEPFVRFAYTSAVVDQGQQTELAVKVEKKKDFAGNAKVELLGLPNEVTSEPREMTKDTTELRFPLRTTAKSPVGHHKSLVCRAVVMAEGQPIAHILPGADLRILQPAPPKAAPAAAPKPEPKPQPKPAEKPLSRLEKLRQERQAGEKK